MANQASTNALIKLTLMAGLIAILVMGNAVAQVMTKTLTFDDPDQVMLISEFGGVITGSGDTVKVEMALPAGNRAEAYKSLDIQAGDIIKMANGKPLDSVKTLKELYEKAAIGDVIKLAIIRDGKPLMVKFAKADPNDQPQGMRMVVTEGPDDSAPTSLMGAGLILAVEDGKIVINDILKEVAPKFTGYTPQKDDIITELNSNKLESPDNLDKLYEAIKPGEDVTLTLLHDGKLQNTSYKKPAEQGTRRVIRKSN
jgi:S1-C subfamily serine protease